MKLIATLILLIGVAVPASAQQIDPDFARALQAVIIDAGYQCRTCEGGHYMGQGYRGETFRVYCNGNSLKYRVATNQAAGTICIEPWDTKNPRCE